MAVCESDAVETDSSASVLLRKARMMTVAAIALKTKPAAPITSGRAIGPAATNGITTTQPRKSRTAKPNQADKSVFERERPSLNLLPVSQAHDRLSFASGEPSPARRPFTTFGR